MADFNTTQTAFDLFKAHGLNFPSTIPHPTEHNAYIEALKELFETDDDGLQLIAYVRDKAALRQLIDDANLWLRDCVKAIPPEELPPYPYKNRSKDLPAAPDEFYKPRRTSTSAEARHKWPE